MKYVLGFLKKNYVLILLFSFTFLAGLPLLHPGLIPTHDGEYHLIRFFEFDKVLRQGVLYPRWTPDLDFGYGIPVLTYVYPLPNYFTSLLHTFGVSFLDSVKLNMFFAIFVGALFFYLWASKYWGKLGGFVAAIVYTYAPYHFVDIYVRGSVGEVWALALFPGFLWTYTEFIKTRKSQYLGLASLFLALTIFSHNILGLMFFTFAITYVLFNIFNEKQKGNLMSKSLLMTMLSLGLSAIFWLPALFETKYVTGLQIYNIAQNFPDMFQLLFPSWGTDFFGNALGNEMSVQIGVVNISIVLVSIFWLSFAIIKKWQNKGIFTFFLLWFVVLFCLMLSWSLPIWLHAPLIHYFQFPWRLLSLVILVCAFLGGGIVFVLKKRIIAILLILFAVLTTYAYMQPAYYMLRNDAYYVSRSNFIDSTNSPGNTFNTIWNTIQSSRPKERILLQNNISLKSFVINNSTNIKINLSAKQDTTQTIAVSYFPSWKVTIDGNLVKIFPNKQGLLSFNLAKGNHTITISQGQTLLEILSQWISIISLVILLVFVFRKKYNKN